MFSLAYTLGVQYNPFAEHSHPWNRSSELVGHPQDAYVRAAGMQG